MADIAASVLVGDKPSPSKESKFPSRNAASDIPGPVWELKSLELSNVNGQQRRNVAGHTPRVHVDVGQFPGQNRYKSSTALTCFQAPSH